MPRTPLKLILILAIISRLATGVPVPQSQSQHDINLVYNLHREFTPRDINELDRSNANKALRDVQATINEVQKLLALDPSLPRLTRGEIEELFETVTKEELSKSIEKGDVKREKHMRALMLVLPYSTNNLSGDNLEELYTRAPITKLVNNDNKLEESAAAISVDSISITSTERNRNELMNAERTVTTYRPRPAATYQPNKRMNPTTFHPRSTMTTTTTTTTTEAPFVTTFAPQPLKKMRKPEKFSSQYNADTSLFVNNNSNKGMTQQPGRRDNVRDILASIGLFPNSLAHSVRKDNSVDASTTTTTTEMPTTTRTTTPASTTTTPSKADIEKAEITSLLKSFGLLNADGKSLGLAPLPQIETEFKPIASSLLKDDTLHVEEFKDIPNKQKFEDMTKAATVPVDFGAFKPIPSEPKSKAKQDMSTGLEEFLKNYGLMDSFSRNKKSMKDAPVLKKIATQQEVDKDEQMMKMPEINTELLTPQMADILGNIGVSMLHSKDPEGVITTTPRLINRRIRKEPANHKSADSVEAAESTTKPVSQKLVAPTPSKSNIFRPSKKSQSAEEDFKKLEQLLETIKELDKLNANLTKKEIHDLNVRTQTLSESLLHSGPDPVKHNEYDSRKNEVKRQNQETSAPTKISLNLNEEDDSASNSTSSSSSSIEIISTITTSDTKASAEDSDADSATTTTTEEPRNNLSDLEDSFSSGADPVTEEPLPPPRRNGFYFLSDWNTFLEVGEEPNKVVIRYDPKVGDPSRFIPINVP